MQTVAATLAIAALAGSLSIARTAPTARAAAETYTVDNTHSAVTFHTKHVGISETYGRFDKLGDTSQVVIDADPAKSSILLIVEAESVNTNSPDRDKHVRSGDFFNAKEFPEIVFESRKIEAAGKDWKVTGDLTFHGVTKSVTTVAHQVGKGEFHGDQLVGLVAEFTIDMNDYGIEFLKQNPNAVGPEVHVTVSLECHKKK